MTTDAGVGIYGSELFGSGINVEDEAPLRPAKIRYFKTNNKNEAGWEMLFQDSRGLAGTEDQFETASAGWQTSTLMHTHPNRLILPPQKNVETLTGSANSTGAFWGRQWGSVFAMAQGSTTNECLMKEDAVDDPTVSFVTYNAGSIISGLYEVMVANVRYLGIFKEGGVIDYQTTFGTSVGTFNAATNPGWGAIISLVNNVTPGTPSNLLYYGTTIGFLSGDAAGGTAPTAVLSNVPGGGYALSAERLGAEPLRAHWVWPFTNSTTSVATSITAVQHVSTNMEGGDPWYTRFPFANTYFPTIWNNSVVATDGYQVKAYLGNGRFRPMSTPIDGEIDSTYSQRVVGLGNRNGMLVAMVAKFKVTGGDLQYLQLRRYHQSLNTWTPLTGQFVTSATVSGADTPPFAFPPLSWRQSANLVISPLTGYFHLGERVVNNWVNDYVFLELPGTDAFVINRRTGVASVGGVPYEASGVWTSRVLNMPYPITGQPLRVETVESGGDADAGGTTTANAYMTFAIGNGDGNFVSFCRAEAGVTGGINWFRGDNPAGPNGAYDQDKLQLQVTAVRHTGTTFKTPNCFPFKVRGRSLVTESQYSELFDPR